MIATCSTVLEMDLHIDLVLVGCIFKCFFNPSVNISVSLGGVMPTIKQRRGAYPKEQLIEAVRAVQEGKMTSVQAAETYQVPQGTIRSHTNDQFLRIGSGRSFYLDAEQEAYLVELLKSLEKIGVRLTKPVLRKVVGEYIRLVAKDPRFKSKQASRVVCCAFLCAIS